MLLWSTFSKIPGLQDILVFWNLKNIWLGFCLGFLVFFKKFHLCFLYHTSQSSSEFCWTLHHLATGSGTTSHSSSACLRIFTNVDFPAAVEKAFRKNGSQKTPTASLFNYYTTVVSNPISESPMYFWLPDKHETETIVHHRSSINCATGFFILYHMTPITIWRKINNDNKSQPRSITSVLESYIYN